MSNQAKQKLQRFFLFSLAGLALAVTLGVGAQILAGVFEVPLEPVAGYPAWVVIFAILAAPVVLFSGAPLFASAFRTLKESGALSILPWTRRKDESD